MTAPCNTEMLSKSSKLFFHRKISYTTHDVCILKCIPSKQLCSGWSYEVLLEMMELMVMMIKDVEATWQTYRAV